MTERVVTEAPSGREIDIKTVVDAIDPPSPFVVVYPKRRDNDREFYEDVPAHARD